VTDKPAHHSMTDLRLAARMIARQPGVAALAILALALGIGLTTTMFCIVNGAIIGGLPLPESERIYHVAPFNTAERRDTRSRAHTVAELVRRQRSFDQVAAFRFGTANVAGADGIPVRYRAAWITPNTCPSPRAKKGGQPPLPPSCVLSGTNVHLQQRLASSVPAD
jgi:hypothetical protein